MYKKFKKDKEEVRHVSEAASPAYRADSHSESYNDYTNAGGHTSSESSRTAEFINVIVKSIMNNMENTVFDKLNTKIDAVDTKVDSNFTALEKSIANVYRNTDIKFAALDTKIDAVDKKVDSNFISLTNSIKSLEKLMNAKFEAVDAKFAALEARMNAKFEAVDAKFAALEASMNAKFAALSKENKIYQKFTLGLGTLILGAAFKEEIMALVMKLFGS